MRSGRSGILGKAEPIPRLKTGADGRLQQTMSKAHRVVFRPTTPRTHRRRGFAHTPTHHRHPHHPGLVSRDSDIP
jgi:hypothetical protein